MSDSERESGLVIVQIDGLSRPALDGLLARGRMPILGSLVSSGSLTLEAWVAMLPPSTPASQAGILHGNNEGIPGFRWYEKADNRLLVANHAGDAAEIERRLSTGDGLLAHEGASVGNLLAGDAAFSHLTMATIEGDGPNRASDQGTFSRDPRSYVRIPFEMIRELLDEIVQARRQRLDDVRPRMPRGAVYALQRVVTNVPLRILSTWTVIHEIEAGRPVIYVDFTGYDEIAHHCGPGRPESDDAAEKIDRSVGHILRAAARAPRRYHLVVLSDHGQCLGASFRQRYGTTLVELIASQTEESTTFHVAMEPGEYADGLTRIANAVLGSRRVTTINGVLERRPGANHHRPSRIVDGHGAPVAVPADAQVADVVVCASGNLGLVYFTSSPDRLSREEIESSYPGLLAALVDHPGIGVVVVRSKAGVLAIGAGGTNLLDEGRVVGDDPLAAYGPMAAEGLRRVAGFDNSGDLIAIGRYDPDSGEVVSFEELIGSHGGLGGRQAEPFLAYPAPWRLDAGPLIGAPSVNGQLRRWMADLGIGTPG